jgi:hypothetical protein
VSIKKEEGGSACRGSLPVKMMGAVEFSGINKRYLSIVFGKILRYKIEMPV